ncbi:MULTISPECIES: hypothetical protein [unclassified Rhizobium]|uniref:hypothetical protein n=1 Tax=unclassified Rhizobium TaxID=2613769 RepID=UPI001C82B63C|nr:MULTISPECIES: hypothetical protein [unclassified Rhizobium]MBX5159364.1 hypothetical protein [Rhizobium sp. NZLR8]MBX5167721.1 hypothetical protein [Rhizobium sp. NZLR4b]MBX5170880.1 hypothetical protein [Rhizobium sp. NZLR1b]MBX5181658.1 hypothetical protein [Rhizobium sp. NZLR5]MBX5211742.1 hypothetical protein [Rhizobium sp. NZLR11]
MTVSVQKIPGLPFAVSARRRDPASGADHVAGSRAMGHGAELRQSALDAPAEGIGLTSTDPAFFDTADLADGAGFGNGSADTITPFQAVLLEGLKPAMPFA